MARQRSALNRETILETAVAIADADGIEAVSMRRLGQALGVDAMALYRHVRDKDELLDGMVDLVVGSIRLPRAQRAWRPALRARIMAARAVMVHHPWVPGRIEAQTTPGPAVFDYMEGALATLYRGGFTTELAHHALHVLGSRLLGFGQDLFDDRGATAPSPEAAALMARTMADRYPSLTELATSVSHEGGLGGCDDDVEFAFALDLILDGLERRLDA